MPVAEIDFSPNLHKPVTREVIDFYMGQLECYRQAIQNNPALEPYMAELERDIEDMRRELNAVSGGAHKEAGM
jgi:hypothetical protein